MGPREENTLYYPATRSLVSLLFRAENVLAVAAPVTSPPASPAVLILRSYPRLSRRLEARAFFTGALLGLAATAQRRVGEPEPLEHASTPRLSNTFALRCRSYALRCACCSSSCAARFCLVPVEKWSGSSPELSSESSSARRRCVWQGCGVQ